MSVVYVVFPLVQTGPGEAVTCLLSPTAVSVGFQKKRLCVKAVMFESEQEAESRRERGSLGRGGAGQGGAG